MMPELKPLEYPAISVDATLPVPGTVVFRRRYLAFGIDCLILALCGAGIGAAFPNVLAHLGGWARAVGFFLALGYFGAMDSCHFGGQTLGKRVMRLQTVGWDGRSLSFARSALRYGVIGVPFFLNKAPIDLGGRDAWLEVPLSVLVFGVGLSALYLFAFNRETGRSLHDLATGTQVVPVHAPMMARRGGIGFGHRLIVAVILGLSALTPAVLLSAQAGPLTPIRIVHDQIVGQAGVAYGSVSVESDSRDPNPPLSSMGDLTVAVAVKSADWVSDATADRLARLVLQNLPLAQPPNLLRISVAYGYDIGIWSSWASETIALTPVQWRARWENSDSRSGQDGQTVL